MILNSSHWLFTKMLVIFMLSITWTDLFRLFPLQVKPFPFISLPGCCPSCKEAGVSHQLTTSGVVIVVNEKGSVKTNELHVMFIEMKNNLLFICTLMEHLPVIRSYWFVKHSSAFFSACFFFCFAKLMLIYFLCSRIILFKQVYHPM